MHTPNCKTPTKRPSQDNRSTSPFQKFRNKCICEICNCNTHHCPKEDQVINKIVPVSHQDYKYPMDFQPASIIKPLSQYIMQKADPGHFQTSNQMNFKPNCFETPNREKVKRCGVYKNNSNVNTTPKAPGIYDTEYKQGVAKEKDINYVHPHRAKEKPLKSLPFDAKTLYQDTFHLSNYVDKVSPFKPEDNLKSTSKSPFTSRSNYNQEYVKYPFDGQPNYYNRNKEDHFYKGNDNLKPKSHYQDSFVKYDPNAYSKPECPMKFLPKPPRNLSPGRKHIIYDDKNNDWVN